MDKENTQKELFEFDRPKKQPHRFGAFFQKTDITICLGAEKLVFISIGVIMLLVISFALGVERGKTLSSSTNANVTIVQSAAGHVSPAKPTQQTLQTKTAAVVSNIAPKDKLLAGTVKTSGPVVQVQNTVVDKAKPYTIVAAAFSKEVFATKEVARLKSNGFEALEYYREPYYLACVGSFANKDSAQKILSKVKQLYRDAYIRLK